jgi:uncharacterized protein YgiM (DUF1202 family)
MFRTFFAPRYLIFIATAALLGCSSGSDDAVVLVDVGSTPQVEQSISQDRKIPVIPQQSIATKAQPDQVICKGNGEEAPPLEGITGASYQVQPGPQADALWVRSTPSIAGKIIGCLKRGDTVEIVRVEQDWALVQLASGDGWVWKSFLLSPNAIPLQH